YTTDITEASLIPGTTDTTNHCDDCLTPISFPFPVTVYGQTFTTASVSSNGALELIPTDAFFSEGCLSLPNEDWDMTIFAYQDDLRTDNNPWTGCSAFPGAQCGVFTGVTGTAPNRQFHIEWRATHFDDTSTSPNFEIRFYEGNSSFFDIFYQNMSPPNDNGSNETTGVQANGTFGPSTNYSCGTVSLFNGWRARYPCPGLCGSPPPPPTSTAPAPSTPTATATATFTPTSTATATFTPTATVAATATATATATFTPTPTPTPTCTPS